MKHEGEVRFGFGNCRPGRESKIADSKQVRASREKIAAKFLSPPSQLTPLQRLMQWSVSNRRSRTISPSSQVTVSEWLENRIKEGTVEGLRAAMQIDPANARVTAYLGRRLADQALKQALIPTKPGVLEEKLTFQQAVHKSLLPTTTKLRSCATE